MGWLEGLVGRFGGGIGWFEDGRECFGEGSERFVSGIGNVRYWGVRSESWVFWWDFELVRSKSGGASFASKPANW